LSAQKAFVFDVNKCTGCSACQIACSIENRVDPGISWRRVHTFNPRHLPGVPSFHHSMACNHCVDPPCMKHCPALAYSKDPQTGAVTIDAESCIGCKYCSWACPYDAPQFNRSSGTMEKCTFCTHRLEDGLEPACVALCPTGALQFGDHEPSDRPAVAGFTKTDIGPAIRFVPLRKWKEPGAMPGTANRTGTGAHRAAGAPGRINLRSEWTLMVFSFLAALLVGRYASALIEPSESPFAPAGPIHPLLMPLLGAGAMVLSTLHLGRRRRAWRSVLNWRRSWLSREVMLFPAFLAVASASVVLQPSGPGGVAGWVAAALGFAALFAVDSVYHVTSVPGLRIHSARVFSTGLLFSGLFSANVLLFGLVAAVKAFLYLWRKYSFYGEHRDVRPWFTRVRVLIGLLAPLVLWWLGEPRWYPLLVVAVIAGELIDRAEFYIELEAPSPARQMYADLAAIFQKKG
jgi:DMSO reductase iron-sulfur subunit